MRRLLATSPALAIALALSLGSPTPAPGQGLEAVKARYTKYEYRIPMRDGARLFTSVYVPKDAGAGGGPYPILMTRTPYTVSPYGVDQYKPDLGPSPLFGKSGYIFAYQDVRGRFMSEGEFVNMRPEKAGDKVDESTDTYDTIDWLLKNVPGHNGRVGMYGISYPGFYTACGLIDSHPALKAASPQAPVTDWFVGDDWHHNGAFFLTHCFNFLAAFGHPRPEPTRPPKDLKPFDYGTPDGYDFLLRLGPLSAFDGKVFKGDVPFWNEVMGHGTYDAWWKARNVRPHLKNVRPAVMTVGGWFDAENLFGALECYKAIEKSSPQAAANTLVMGPWFHGGWSRDAGSSLGYAQFNSKTSEFYREHIEFPFFERYLKGRTSAEAELPEAYAFETGKNQWRKFESWPPKGVKPTPVYLRAGGALAFEPPDESGDAADTYDSDPARPVPFVGDTVNSMVREYMVADQRFASKRPDVLVYQTPVLEQDVTAAGPVKVTLHVATTGTDADWVVKVIDVYPDDTPDPTPNPTGVRLGGFQQLVRGDVFRGKFRKGFDAPEAFRPGEPAEVSFTLPDLCHTFRPGHRLMVQVQSSWFPLVDRNPQTFVDIYKATPADFRKATQTVFRSKDRPSKLELSVLP